MRVPKNDPMCAAAMTASRLDQPCAFELALCAAAHDAVRSLILHEALEAAQQKSEYRSRHLPANPGRGVSTVALVVGASAVAQT